MPDASSFTEVGLRDAGFAGFVSLRAAYANGCRDVPVQPGVYVVIRRATGSPKFEPVSRAGWFKDRDPSTPISTLCAKWVTGSPVVYVGKATSLRRRVQQLLAFGNGEPVGHWGGRYLWQLADADELLLAWRPESEPRRVEAGLIAAFVGQFGTRPFANLAD